MKKITMLISALLFGSSLHAQQVPTINAPPNGVQSNGSFWARAGNLNTGGNQCSEGVYFYMLKTKTINKTGFIQLIR